MITKEKKKINYLDDAKFYEALVKRRQVVNEAKLNGNILPRASDYIGKCILDLCKNMAQRYNFNGYSFKSEMIDKGVEDCVAAIDYFDTEKYKKPYSYFTMIAWRAFVRVIAEEKKENYLKHKLFVENKFQNILLDNSFDNHYINALSEDLTISSDIIAKYEDDLNNKKKEKVKKKKASSNGVMQLIENGNE